jgi:hypothetical protein
MLTKVKNNYKSILKHFDFDKSMSSADYKRQKLIEMAKSGAKKPSRRTKEGLALVNYTKKLSSCYCPKFDKIIRKRRPDWFESTSKTMKQKLIAMAKSGAKKPSRRTKEGQALCNYARKVSSCYFPEFDKIIRELRPDWFESTSIIMKQKLIAIAKSGAKRPHHKTKDGRALDNYTRKLSSCYCPKFDKIIRKRRPDWFRKKRTFAK